MDGRSKRSRRGRGYSCGTTSQPRSFVESFSSFLILSSLVGVIYLMLEYHCTTCNSSSDLNNINKSIADISKNLACMKHRYHELEMKISRFSQEIPKIEGQIEIMEALTYAIQNKESRAWDPRRSLPLPNVDVFLNTPPYEQEQNITYIPKKVLKCTT